MGKGEIFDFGIACVRVYKNYGSAFTNFALYKTMKDYGQRLLLINQPTCSEISPLESDNFINSPYPKEECAPFYESREDMKSLNSLCKKFLVGSDQLFNYEIYRKIDSFVLLDWVDEQHEKLSYASSFGVNAVLGEAREFEHFKSCIRRFRHVSVRERFAEDLMKDNFGVTATSVLDPVFLCDKGHYLDALKPYAKPYLQKKIFAYILDPDPKKERLISSAKQRLQGELFTVSDMWRTNEELRLCWSFKTEENLKNEEWLAELYCSDFVITDSFHGLCFSIIFEKPFIAIYNELRGNDRFSSLLNLVGLSERLIKRDDGIDTLFALLDTPIDFKAVNDKLDKERIFSRLWLERYILDL